MQSNMQQIYVAVHQNAAQQGELSKKLTFAVKHSLELNKENKSWIDSLDVVVK